MKRFVLLILLLAMALSMTGCLTVTGGNDRADERPPEEQHLTADVDETEVWHRRHDDVWSGQDEPELVSRDFERINGAAANGMTVGGTILFVLVFCIGHALNFALNLIGCFVHTLRLQFLEFFGKWYRDGGKAFRPLKIQTKYVDIKEE